MRAARLTFRIAFAVLVVLGLTATAMRTAAPDDLIARVDAVRIPMLARLGIEQPNPEQRAAAVAEADGKFAANRLITRVHVLTGAGFLVLASLQLVGRVRTRTPRVHRVSGRVAMILAWLSGVTGLFFGLWQPLAGVAEQVIVGAAGLYLLVSVTIGYRHIRAGRRAAHREWMLRAIAAAVAVSSVRLASLPLDLALTPRGVDIRVVFVLSLWVGWVVTAAGAEWWIRRTRAA